ncbi:hypothetical protein ACFZ8E_07480 [Methylobacterium sp. HMF5984]|uniref:hypothetical protein n=1 Tax=Methylobacterium sp. HMF5984 TaxID=3367370 RepID=UPI0038546D55
MITPYYTQHIRTPETLIYADPAHRYSVWQHMVSVDGEWLVFVHSYVTDWKPSTLRAMRASFAAIRPQLPPVIACMPFRPDRTFHHFITAFGFEQFGTAPCSDGPDRPLYFHFR